MLGRKEVVGVSLRSGGALCRPCLSHGVQRQSASRGVNDPGAAREGWPQARADRVVHATACLSVSGVVECIIRVQFGPAALKENRWRICVAIEGQSARANDIIFRPITELASASRARDVATPSIVTFVTRTISRV